MGVRWKVSGFRPSATQRYTVTTPGFPGGEWATDQISRIHERAVQGMAQAQVNAHTTVLEKARVDTGLMRALVTSDLSSSGESIRLEFGWVDDNPYYAVYQEFGTVHISAMEAVHAAFWDIQGHWRQVLGV